MQEDIIILKEYNKIHLSTASAKREEQDKEEQEERVEGKCTYPVRINLYAN